MANILELHQAIEMIEERPDMDKFNPAKVYLHEQIKSILKLKSINYEELGIFYYYDLRIQLKSHLHAETEENISTYNKMLQAFYAHEKFLKTEIASSPSKSPIYHQKIAELKEFYKKLDNYYFSLETIYLKKNFLNSAQNIFGEKMLVREKNYRYNRKYGLWLSYNLLRLSCDYGRSFWRWALTAAIFAISFSIIFYLLGEKHIFMAHPSSTDFIDYFYFSIVAFTTLGFGDIVPITVLGKIVTSMEVILGYIMLGMLMTLIQKRI